MRAIEHIFFDAVNDRLDQHRHETEHAKLVNLEVLLLLLDVLICLDERLLVEVPSERQLHSENRKLIKN